MQWLSIDAIDNVTKTSVVSLDNGHCARKKNLLYILTDRSHHRIGHSISFVLKKFNLELTHA